LNNKVTYKLRNLTYYFKETVQYDFFLFQYLVLDETIILNWNSNRSIVNVWIETLILLMVLVQSIVNHFPTHVTILRSVKAGECLG